MDFVIKGISCKECKHVKKENGIHYCTLKVGWSSIWNDDYENEFIPIWCPSLQNDGIWQLIKYFKGVF